MLDSDRPLDDSEYEDDDRPSRPRDLDPISQAVGSAGFIGRHIIDECRQELQDGTGRKLFPERFDRFYFEPHHLLIDVVSDETAEAKTADMVNKRVDFKQGWCAENGWAYVAVPGSLSGDVQAVQELIARACAPKVKRVQDGLEDVPVKRGPGRPRGSVQRPKAAV